MALENGAHTEAINRPFNNHLSSIKTTIFSVMTQLSQDHNSINLGQGFPDEEGPDAMKRHAGSALFDYNNQYPPFWGVPEARQAVARHSEKYQDLPLEWQTQTLMTVGATEALAAALMGLLNRGDEVIVFDPQYDAYIPLIMANGGVPKMVQLNLADWSVPHDALATAFNERTKAIIINSPHNPTGKVFAEEDLRFIGELCKKWGTYAILDEVYEHLVFEGSRHVSLRSLPGMLDRCVQIGSAGKTFSLTGWKIGWVTGPTALIAAVAKAHQFITFTVPSSLQRAVAYGLDNESSFYLGLGKSLQEKRGILERNLKEIGFRVLPAQGTYFLVADFSPLLPPGSTEDDVAFCQRLTTEAGVTPLPVSAFYAGGSPPRTLVRFCFCKTDEKLTKACSLLQKYFAGNGR